MGNQVCTRSRKLALQKFFRSLFLSNVKALKLNSLSLLLLKPPMFASVKVIYKKIMFPLPHRSQRNTSHFRIMGARINCCVHYAIPMKKEKNKGTHYCHCYGYSFSWSRLVAHLKHWTAIPRQLYSLFSNTAYTEERAQFILLPISKDTKLRECYKNVITVSLGNGTSSCKAFIKYIKYFISHSS